MTPGESKIWIITGPCQVGKTHFCSYLIQLAQSQGLSLAGVICPPVYDEQQKTAITIENLKTHELRTLAKVRTAETEGVYTDHWVFDEKVLAWGNQVLANTEGSDLLLIDELGPLEFNRGKGWQNGILAIDQGEFQIAVVVIRPSLLETAVKRWPKAQVIEIPSSLGLEKMNQLFETILYK